MEKRRIEKSSRRRLLAVTRVFLVGIVGSLVFEFVVSLFVFPSVFFSGLINFATLQKIPIVNSLISFLTGVVGYFQSSPEMLLLWSSLNAVLIVVYYVLKVRAKGIGDPMSAFGSDPGVVYTEE